MADHEPGGGSAVVRVRLVQLSDDPMFIESLAFEPSDRPVGDPLFEPSPYT